LRLPRIRIKFEERAFPTFQTTLLTSFVALLIVLGVCSVFLVNTGVNPFIAYYLIVRGAFGNVMTFAETISLTGTLLLSGLAVTVAFRVGFFNIGVEGQLITGAIAATGVGLALGGVMPIFVNIPLIILASFVAGGLTSFVPGAFKVKFRANEVLTTLMLNAILALVLSWLCHGPWREPGGWPETVALDASATLPVLMARTRLHAGIFIAIAALIAVYILFKKTTLGYKIRAVGANPDAAYSHGIKRTEIFLTAAFLSGGLGGLMGAIEITGVQHYLFPNFSLGYGYIGVMIALIGRLNPVGVVIAAFSFAALINGSQVMQTTTGIPFELTNAIQAVTLIIFTSAEILNFYKIRVIRK